MYSIGAIDLSTDHLLTFTVYKLYRKINSESKYLLFNNNSHFVMDCNWLRIYTIILYMYCFKPIYFLVKNENIRFIRILPISLMRYQVLYSFCTRFVHSHLYIAYMCYMHPICMYTCAVCSLYACRSMYMHVRVYSLYVCMHVRVFSLY